MTEFCRLQGEAAIFVLWRLNRFYAMKRFNDFSKCYDSGIRFQLMNLQMENG